MFYGNVWKKVIIDRPELWIGIRSDPTFLSEESCFEAKLTSSTRRTGTLLTHTNPGSDCRLKCLHHLRLIGRKSSRRRLCPDQAEFYFNNLILPTLS